MSEETTAETMADNVETESSSTMIYAIVALVVAGIAGAAYYFMVLKNKKPKRKEVELDEAIATNTVGLGDIAYIAAKLHPESDHMDVLWSLLSTPESVAYGLRGHRAKEKLIAERKKQDMEESKTASQTTKPDTSGMFDFDDDGWAEDEDEDMDEEAKMKAKLAKETEEQKKKDREQLKKAVGKTKVLLEGIDDGVIGQKWVEKTLEANGVWPPKNLGILEGAKFEYEGKQVGPLDHPGVRRNMCMMMGRLNSNLLNSHPELLEAGMKQLVDQSYFKGSMEFRGRCGLLLEASLRTAVACRSSTLSKTILEAFSMFKIGCTSPTQVEWFNGVMEKTYQCLPQLKVENTGIECPGQEEMATGDILAIGLDVTRTHAEAFTKQKIAMFQKQGIPPQVALQAYREGWWFLVQAERLDGETPASTLDIKTDGMLREVDTAELAKFEKAPFNERLMTAWPMIVQNVAQKSGKVKIQCLAPAVPGKYKFTVTVKSNDFLGADQEFSVEGTILDASTITRKPKEEIKESEENSEDTEAKKEK